VYDLQGRRVRTLAEEDKPAGRYSVPWAGQNDAGQAVAPGIYFYRLHTPQHTATQKLLKVS
jgi:flagellar hook assembly protein FlgD